MSRRPETRLIALGAEAALYLTDWLGRPAVAKVRLEKPYRHPAIDRMLRVQRTINEARMMLRAMELGVPVPELYEVRVSEATIIMEYVPGRSLRWVIEERGVDESVEGIVEALGRNIAVLHEHGLTHGDVTTSNVLVYNGGYKLIDFGLAEATDDEEDKAVDIHLFLRAVESTHPEYTDRLYGAFLRGYRAVRGEEKTQRVLELVKKIRLMGRYVEERRKRKLVWSIGGEERA